MRVLMISLDRGLVGAGGTGDTVERHRKYADLAGELDIIVFASAKFSETVLAPNLRIYPTRSSKFAHYHRAVERAKKLIKEKRYDLLITQDFTAPVGLKIKKFLDLPWIVGIHSMFFSQAWLGFHPVHWYLWFLIKRAIRSADGFRVNNNEIRDKLISWGIKQPILVQPTPIDITKFKNQKSKIKMTSQNSKVTVLYVGRLAAEKNVAMLIRAFKNLRGDFELWIVGQGPEERELKRLAADDLRIYFLGQKSSDELPEIFAEADVFVLPSNTESFGQVLLQAAASGCALIATATPGAKSILGGHESGILIPVGSQRDLERSLKNFLTKRFEREYWAQKAGDMAEKYDAVAGLDRTIIFWREIASLRSQ